ncbi:hypothetical protein EDD86DRAFT_277906 [Gorgonomyces haynaldii]|nr:hypothetical protein EDD86DRAFT_277906 [Gorgonomyces haynaldii]
MHKQIEIATQFLCSYIPNCPQEFQDYLQAQLHLKLQHSWYPQSPQQASAYRTVQILNYKPDQLLRHCLQQFNIPYSLFPAEMVLWIDPDSVSYRLAQSYTTTLWTQKKSISISPPRTFMQLPQAVN